MNKELFDYSGYYDKGQWVDLAKCKKCKVYADFLFRKCECSSCENWNGCSWSKHHDFKCPKCGIDDL